MVISLLVILISIPRLFRDITTAICVERAADAKPSIQTLVWLGGRARKIRDALLLWHSRYVPVDALQGQQSMSDDFYSVLVLFYITTIYSNRLNTCFMWPGHRSHASHPALDALELEAETQQLAGIILGLSEEEKSYGSLQSSLLLAQKLPIAEAIRDSALEWSEELRRCIGSDQGVFILDEHVFTAWCGLFGRSTG